MNNGAEARLVDLLRDIPTDHRTGWVTQLDEAGNETGHAMCPIGSLAHKAADLIQSQKQRIAELEKEVKASVEEIRDSYLIISGQYSHRDAIEADKAELLEALDHVWDAITDWGGNDWVIDLIAKHKQLATGDSNDL
jgi:hypothetical protein